MKFLFLTLDFAMGGVTSSLINLTSALVSEGHDVSILCLHKNNNQQNNLLLSVPIQFLDGKAALRNAGKREFIDARGVQKIFIFLRGIVKKFLRRINLEDKYVFSSLPVFECDVAVSFQQSNALNYIATRKTNARKKIAFVHSEIDCNPSGWMRYYDKMDCIACVSNAWAENFKRLYPCVQKKVYTVYNLFDSNNIKELANKDVVNYTKNYFNIVTVSRIASPPKNIEWIPEIAAKLKEHGLRFHWTIVGDGPSRNVLENNIQNTGTSDVISLTGAKMNPYPYIEKADLFVLLSSWESYGMVLMESLILGTPVVTTCYPAAFEIIEDGKTGIICENSPEAIADSVLKIATNIPLLEMLTKNCKAFEYDKRFYLEKFLRICE